VRSAQISDVTDVEQSTFFCNLMDENFKN